MREAISFSHVLNLWEEHSVSIKFYISYRFCQCTLSGWGSYVPLLLRVLVIKEWSVLSNVFFASTDKLVCFFFFLLLLNIEPSLHSQDVLKVYFLSYIIGFELLVLYLTFLHLFSWGILVYRGFFVLSFSGLVYQGNAGLKWFGKCSSFFGGRDCVELVFPL